MRVIFAGTPEFAVVALKAIIESGFNVIAVYTQPDRPAGRGRRLSTSAVKCYAQQQNLLIQQPESLRSKSAQAQLCQLQPDIMVVAAYGIILPQAVLDIPRYGCLNIHASLLPRWRGAAPIQRAMLAGDSETGVSIMQMAQGLDSGDVLSSHYMMIAPDDTATSLHDKLAQLGAESIVETLQQLQQGEPLIHTPQNPALVTYAEKINKSEAQLDWSDNVINLHTAIRAYNPYPIAYTYIAGQRLKIWSALIVLQDSDQKPGTIINVDKQGIDVACGQGILRITILQWPGAKPISVVDALNAQLSPLQVGATLGALSH